MTATHAPAPAVGRTRTRDVVLGVAGLAFFVPLLLVIAVPHAGLDYPVTKPPAGHVITAFYTAHATLEQYQTVMHSIAAIALAVFFVSLAALVPSARAASLTRLGGLGAATVMLLTMVLVSAALSQTGGVDGQVLGWMYQVGWTAHFAAVFWLPVALVPGCGVLARDRVLPVVLARAGQVVGVLGGVALVSVPFVPFLRFPVFFLLMLWVLATAVVALTRGLGTDEVDRRVQETAPVAPGSHGLSGGFPA